MGELRTNHPICAAYVSLISLIQQRSIPFCQSLVDCTDKKQKTKTDASNWRIFEAISSGREVEQQDRALEELWLSLLSEWDK